MERRPPPPNGPPPWKVGSGVYFNGAKSKPAPPGVPPPSHGVSEARERTSTGDRNGPGRPFGVANAPFGELRRSDSTGSIGSSRSRGSYDYYNDRPRYDSSNRETRAYDQASVPGRVGEHTLSRESSGSSSREDRSNVGAPSANYRSDSAGYNVSTNATQASSSYGRDVNPDRPRFAAERKPPPPSGLPPQMAGGQKKPAPPPPPGPPPVVRRMLSAGGDYSGSSTISGNSNIVEGAKLTRSSSAPVTSNMDVEEGEVVEDGEIVVKTASQIRDNDQISEPGASTSGANESAGSKPWKSSTSSSPRQFAAQAIRDGERRRMTVPNKIPDEDVEEGEIKPSKVSPSNTDLFTKASEGKHYESGGEDDAIILNPKTTQRQKQRTGRRGEKLDEEDQFQRNPRRSSEEESEDETDTAVVKFKRQTADEREETGKPETAGDTRVVGVLEDSSESPRIKKRPGRKPKKAADNTSSDIVVERKRPGRKPKSTLVSKQQVSREEDDHVEDTQDRDEDEGIGRGRRKGRGRQELRLNINATQNEDVDEGAAAEYGDNEEEHPSVATYTDGEGGLRRMKKKRRGAHRDEGQEGADVVSSRAAKKRAVELIGKPKTPSGTVSASAEENIFGSTHANPKHRLVSRQSSSAGTGETGAGGTKKPRRVLGGANAANLMMMPSGGNGQDEAAAAETVNEADVEEESLGVASPEAIASRREQIKDLLAAKLKDPLFCAPPPMPVVPPRFAHKLVYQEVISLRSLHDAKGSPSSPPSINPVSASSALPELTGAGKNITGEKKHQEPIITRLPMVELVSKVRRRGRLSVYPSKLMNGSSPSPLGASSSNLPRSGDGEASYTLNGAGSMEVLEENNLDSSNDFRPETAVSSTIVIPSMSVPSHPQRPQDTVGWRDLDEWAARHHSDLVAIISKKRLLERNHAQLSADEYVFVSKQFALLKEQQRLLSETQAQQDTKRYPSRKNPAAVTMELGPDHSVAEQMRREKERRKNTAFVPDMENREEYIASVFARGKRLTTDGRPQLCWQRPCHKSMCVSPRGAVPTLLVPSPIGCNCAKAVFQSERLVWTDAEKCLFIDKFLQHPKDFQRIASYFTSKSTEDCVEFYYDTKKMCDYKSYMAEHVRLRRSGGGAAEFAHVREVYLAKLGVKLPLFPDHDASTPVDAFGRRHHDETLPKVKVPCVMLSRVDVFPKPASADPRLDVYPRPAFLGPDTIHVDHADVVAWFARG